MRVRFNTASLFLNAFATLALSGCLVGPKYHPPQMPAPPVWGSEPADAATKTYGGAVDSTWWTSFHDAELTSLVTRLAKENLDLKTAAERVEQARDARQIARAAGLPSLNANASYTRVRASPNAFLSLVTQAPGAPLDYNFFADNVSVSWDLDLFGRVRRSVEAAEANTQAAIEERHGIALAAISEVAQDYMQLRGVQAREAIIEDNLKLAEENLRLVKDRFDNGVSTTLDVANAQAQRASIAALIPPVEAYKAGLINAIGLLLAQPPRVLEKELEGTAPQPPTPLSVPVGLPGDLIRRRPDVREAEAVLHAATAETGVAVANFYPDVSLSGHFGAESLSPGTAFSWASRAFEIGPSISIPIFEGGRLRGTLRLRQSQQREAVLSFQKTVLNAWREADDSLTDLAQAQRARTEIATAVHQNELALVAARQGYTEGAIDFLNVISVQAALLQSQSQLVNVETEINTRLVGLYRSLGGGWEIAK
ncbi:MAG TPA: efflux transporter outer membrane subunit [Terriglobales bacterium]